ncbi:MAG: hypothetical protein HYZ69_03320, partial [Candidatus Colwellbacteria bacterium]|nr:hypothetical protein [Candidatus Colwellbacteria bacterium]
IQVTGLGPVPKGATSPRWIKCYGELGDNTIIYRFELTDSSEVWENIREGDVVTLRHHLEYWPLFGKVIEKTHSVQLLK